MSRLRTTARVIDGITTPNNNWVREPVGQWHPTARLRGLHSSMLMRWEGLRERRTTNSNRELLGSELG